MSRAGVTISSFLITGTGLSPSLSRLLISVLFLVLPVLPSGLGITMKFLLEILRGY